MNRICFIVIGWLFTIPLLSYASPAQHSYDVTFVSQLDEMVDRNAIATWPEHEYKPLLASSYNRATQTPDDPRGWFANGDTGFYIREENNQGRREFVMMEHDGPGVITKMWTPFFHQDFNNRVGETIRIYLDDNPEPVIETNHIGLLTEQWKIKPPFSIPTPRAGNLYLPIPFAKSCKITIENSVFFYNINYRAYLDPNLKVETFHAGMLDQHAIKMDRVGKELQQPTPPTGTLQTEISELIESGESTELQLPNGSHTIRQMTFKLDSDQIGQAMRSTVLEIAFDGQTTVWCPIGDFFSNVRTIEPYRTWERDVHEDGTMLCRWVMPYDNAASIRVHNLGESSVNIKAVIETTPSIWTDRSMHFYAGWRVLGPLPPDPKLDMNFVEIVGRGVHVGDSIAVVNPNWMWWGEGDEKIYVDDDFDRRFPSQIGTGTEDYYGWAGGLHPTRDDEFSSPFLANTRVGGEPMPDQKPGTTIHTRGYNICTRTRALDANLFRERFKFDLEHWNLSHGALDWLHYSKVVFWYASPGSTHNHKPLPEEVAKPLETPESVHAYAMNAIEADRFAIEDAIDFELMQSRTMPDHLVEHTHAYRENRDGSRFNNDSILFLQHAREGDRVDFLIPEQYVDRQITLYMVRAADFGTLDIYVNGQRVIEGWDGYSADVSASGAIDLGKHTPDGSKITLSFIVTGKNEQSTGTYLGLDCVVLQ